MGAECGSIPFFDVARRASSERRMAQVESFERRKCFVCAGNELQRSPPHEKVLFFAFLNEVSEEMMSVEDSSDRRRLRSLKLFEGAVGRVSEPAQLAHCQGRRPSRPRYFELIRGSAFITWPLIYVEATDNPSHLDLT